MGEKFRKGFLKVMEPLEPYFETLDKTIMPVLKWFEKWIWLIGALVCLVIYIWKSIIHHYVDQYSIGQALSITFGEMLVIILKIGLVVLISWSIFWLLSSILITWMNQNLEKRKAAEAIIVPDQPAAEHPEEKPNVTQAQETSVVQVEESTPTQAQETPVEKVEESPAQPEPTDQEPAVEQAEVVDSEEIIESEDTEEETKRPYVRGEDHGKASKVTIDHDRFRSVFKLIFMKRNADTGSCSYDILVRTLESRSWTKSDLARIALLIHQSDVLKGDTKDFNKWLVEFFEIMGRDDIPETKTKSAYKDLSASSINFRQVFNDLVYTYYAKTEKSTLKFDIPISK